MGCGASQSADTKDDQKSQKGESGNQTAAAPAATGSALGWSPPPGVETTALGSDDPLSGQPSTYVPRFLVQQFMNEKEKLKPASHKDWTMKGAALCVVDISGYTKMNEHFAKLGPAGVEKLSSHLKKYFTQLIDILHANGGDVIKFAGDALFVVFFNEPFDVAPADPGVTAVRGVQAALQLQKEAGEYRVETSVMTLHVAVGLGDIRFLACGIDEEEGPHSFEFFLAGPVLDQIATAVDVSKSGQVCVSADAWQAAQSYLDGEKVAETGEYLIHKVTKPVDPIPIPGNIMVPKTEAFNYNMRTFVPRTVLDKLDSGQAGYLAELRRISVMFVNLEGLELGAGKIDTSKVADAVTGLNTIIKQNDGYRRQFMRDDKGTVLIIAWGCPPYVHEDDQYRATKCGLQMHAYLTAKGIKHSLGITTGDIFSGSPGSDTRHEHGVIGDTVNASARLAFTPRKGNFLVDEATKKAIEDRISLKSEGSIKVKGKEILMNVFRPLSIKASRSKAVIKDVIGRDKEINTGVKLVDDFQETGKGGVILIRGPAGSGKSVVLGELRRQVDKHNLLYYDADADETEHNTAFYIFRRLVSQILGLSDEMSPAEKVAATQKCLEGLPQDVAMLGPLLNHVLPDLQLPENDMTKQFAADSMTAMINELLTKLIQAYLKVERTVLFIEDAQFICSKSWGLLQSLGATKEDTLLIVSTRPVTAESSEVHKSNLEKFEAIEGLTTFEMEPFDPSTTENMLKSRLEVKKIDPKVLSFIMERSHGNPLYSVELASALIADKSLEISVGELKAGESFGKGSVPSTLQGLIAQRVDKMSPDEQLLCKLASVFGREFLVEALKSVHMSEQTGSSSSRYEGLLTDLSGQGIFSQSEGEELDVGSAFRHVFIQQACYDVLLYSQKAKLHKMIAEWYEGRFEGDAINAHVGVLAYHYSQCVQTDKESADVKTVLKAAFYLAKQADEALTGGSMPEAVAIAKEGVTVTEEHIEKDIEIKAMMFQFLLKTGSALSAMFGFLHPDVIAVYERADKIKDELPEDKLGDVMPVLFLLRLFQCLTGDYGKSCPNGELMYRVAKGKNDLFGQFMAARALCQCGFVMGNTEKLEKWVGIVEETYDPVAHGHNYRLTGGVDGYCEANMCRTMHGFFMGNYNLVKTHTDRALKMADKLDLLIAKRFTDDFHLIPHIVLGDWDEAQRIATSAKFTTMGSDPMTLYDKLAGVCHLSIMTKMGQGEVALEHAAGARPMVDMMQDVAVVSMYLSTLFGILVLNLGEALEKKELVEEARTRLNHYTKLATSTNCQNTMDGAMIHSGRASVLLGDNDAAEKSFREGIDSAKKRGFNAVAVFGILEYLKLAKTLKKDSEADALKKELGELVAKFEGEQTSVSRKAEIEAALA